MLFIKERYPSLNTQTYPIRAKLVFLKKTFHNLLSYLELNIFYYSYFDLIMTLAKRRNVVKKVLLCFYEIFYRNFFYCLVRCFKKPLFFVLKFPIALKHTESRSSYPLLSCNKISRKTTPLRWKLSFALKRN